MLFKSIHQVLPFLAYGDAIGNQVLQVRRVLREWGYASEIFAENWDPRLAKECRSYQEYKRFSHPDNLLILHYSIGGQVNRFVLSVPDRVAIYYHNITPAHFFYGVNGEMAHQLDQARRDLQLLVGKVPAIADSPYNQQELEHFGFRVLGVAPPILTFEHLQSSEDVPSGYQISRHDTINWLCIGRLAPNKCLQDVIKCFYYFHVWIEPQSRLLLVGSAEGMQPYLDELHSLVSRLGLDDSVVFTGQVESVRDYYRRADIYVSMSEHEGFCIPLVEAMFCNVPILAYASTNVPFTLGDSGVQIKRKEYALVAEMAYEVITNISLKERLLERQRERVRAFAPNEVRAQFRACLDALQL